MRICVSRVATTVVLIGMVPLLVSVVAARSFLIHSHGEIGPHVHYLSAHGSPASALHATDDGGGEQGCDPVDQARSSLDAATEGPSSVVGVASQHYQDGLSCHLIQLHYERILPVQVLIEESMGSPLESRGISDCLSAYEQATARQYLQARGLLPDLRGTGARSLLVTNHALLI